MINLFGMTLTYNEEVMVPYIMPYYERMGFNKLVIYDNESTDNTVNLLKQYKFVEIRTFSTKDGKHNDLQSKLKSDFFLEYKNRENTWLYISDFDEVLFYNGNFKEYLSNMDKMGYTHLNQNMLELICDKFPQKDRLVHENIQFGSYWEEKFGCKLTLFKVNNVNSIQYGPGAHGVNIQLKNERVHKSLNNKDIKSFHIKYIDKMYVYQKTVKANKRRSQEDIEKGYGVQYPQLSVLDNFNQFWNDKMKNAIKINEYI